LGGLTARALLSLGAKRVRGVMVGGGGAHWRMPWLVRQGLVRWVEPEFEVELLTVWLFLHTFGRNWRT